MPTMHTPPKGLPAIVSPDTPVLPRIPTFPNCHFKLVDPAIPGRNGGQVNVESLLITDERPGAGSGLDPGKVTALTIVHPATNPTSLTPDEARRPKDSEMVKPERRLIVASGAVAELLLSEDKSLPVVDGSARGELLKLDKLEARYGVRLPDGESEGAYYITGLILDRMALTPARGEQPDYNHVNSNGDVTGALPLDHLGIVADHPNALYVQQATRAAGDCVAVDHVVAALLGSKQMELSDNVLVSRALLDHTPAATGEGLQAIVTLTVASEYAQALGLPIGKVQRILAGGGGRVEPAADSSGAADTQSFLAILHDELFSREARLIDATPDDYVRINQRLRSLPALGQLLPPVYNLLRDGLIDLDAVRERTKFLHKHQFPGISVEVTDFLPGHLRTPGSKDDPNLLVAELDSVIVDGSRQPPKAGGGVAVKIEVPAGGNGMTRAREGDLKTPNQRRSDSDKAYQELFLFNSGKAYLEELSAVVRAARTFLRERNVVTLLPAWKEPDGGDVARAANALTPNRVVLASVDPETLDNACDYCTSIDQNNVIGCIDFERLRREGFIPIGHDVPIRGKGMTILATLLYAMSKEMVTPDGYIVHADTDIANMDRKSLAYTRNGLDPNLRRPYRPIEAMAAAAALMPPSHTALAVQPAKVGFPRKTEMKFPPFEDKMNAPDDPYLRTMGLALGRTAWTSPGEGLVLASLYLNTPWQVTTGFDLNRYFSAVAAENFEDGRAVTHAIRSVFAQVNIPSDKIENKPVKERDDYLEVSWATSVFTAATAFYRELFHQRRGRAELFAAVSPHLSEEQRRALNVQGLDPLLPPHFTLEHIKRYNAAFAGVERRVITSPHPETERLDDGTLLFTPEQQYKKAGGPNIPHYRYNPFYLPPVSWMIENGYIDMARIARVKPHKRASSTGHDHGDSPK